MGKYLNIGIVTEVHISKDNLTQTELDKVLQSAGMIEFGIDLDMYTGEINDGYWDGRLRDEIVAQELLEFLKATYDLIRKYVSLADDEKIIAHLEEHDAEAWPDILKECNFFNLQEGRILTDYVLSMAGERYRISFTAASLKFAGKIGIEDDEGLFELFAGLLQQQLEQFKLAKALRVYVNGIGWPYDL